MSSTFNVNRRGFLARSLSLATVPFLSAPSFAAPLLSFFSDAGGLGLGDVAEYDAERALHRYCMSHPYGMRYSPSAVEWLEEHIRDFVRPEDHARVRAAAMTVDALYPYFWVLPDHIPDFATVLAYLDTGEIPEHRRGLPRFHYGIHDNRPKPPSRYLSA